MSYFSLRHSGGVTMPHKRKRRSTKVGLDDEVCLRSGHTNIGKETGYSPHRLVKQTSSGVVD